MNTPTNNNTAAAVPANSESVKNSGALSINRRFFVSSIDRECDVYKTMECTNATLIRAWSSLNFITDFGNKAERDAFSQFADDPSNWGSDGHVLIWNVNKGGSIIFLEVVHTNPEPVTADQVNTVLDFATVAGITNRYAASLHGTAARMSAETFCRFCVLRPEMSPADVYESILPVSRPAYGDILAAADWLLLNLAPEAMEYKPLQAVRSWIDQIARRL